MNVRAAEFFFHNVIFHLKYFYPEFLTCFAIDLFSLGVSLKTPHDSPDIFFTCTAGSPDLSVQSSWIPYLTIAKKNCIDEAVNVYD